MDSQPSSIGQKRTRSQPKVPTEWHLEFPKKGAAEDNTFGGARRIEDAYEKLVPLGQGTYGEVFKAIDKETQEVVAIKKIKMENEKEGFPITAVREIKILSLLASAPDTLVGELMRNNIIRLREIVRSDCHEVNQGKGSVYMVFDYMQHDMAGLLDRANHARIAEAESRGKKTADPPFEIGQVKRYMKQLFLGLALLRKHKILHRDLKNANLLVNNRGELKIADFGLARNFFVSSEKKDGEKEGVSHASANTLMTNRVITLWYRPPELCLGCANYAAEVDMWSAGCIMAEMLTGKALFPGKDEVDQVRLICSVLGAPNKTSMPGCENWKDYDKVMQALSSTSFPSQSILRQTLQRRGIRDEQALDLLEKALTLDPSKRIPALNRRSPDAPPELTAATHPWFNEGMAPFGKMPTYDDSHELGMKNKRAAERAIRDDAKRHHHHGSTMPHHMDSRGAPLLPPPVPSSRGYVGGRGAGAGGGGRGRHGASQPLWQQERR